VLFISLIFIFFPYVLWQGVEVVDYLRKIVLLVLFFPKSLNLRLVLAKVYKSRHSFVRLNQWMNILSLILFHLILVDLHLLLTFQSILFYERFSLVGVFSSVDKLHIESLWQSTGKGPFNVTFHPD
jgi:hypothetical protein